MRTPSGKRTHRVALLMLAVVCLSVGCSRDAKELAAANPLWVDPASRDFSSNPELLERLLESPHRYFRFVNIPFSREVCRRYGAMIEGTPLLNLHGDAHIEQYAVTDLGRGLTDFDDSSTGPAILDFLRFGVSLRLACLDQDCGDPDALFDEFLRGYRTALENPMTENPEPAAARRIREHFKSDRESYLQWVASVMEPMPDAEKEALEDAMGTYVRSMHEQDPSLDQGFFDLVDAGHLRMGVGSALDLKYLVRVRGDTDAPMDDAVLEVKEVRRLEEIDCIRTSQGADPFRVLLGQTRIAYEPFEYLGYIRLEGRTLWIHAWVENYQEVEVGKSFRSPDELAEVVFDVGVQLGRGHTNHIAAPLDIQLREEQLLILERDQAKLGQAAEELADLTIEAWHRFRAASE